MPACSFGIWILFLHVNRSIRMKTDENSLYLGPFHRRKPPAETASLHACRAHDNHLPPLAAFVRRQCGGFRRAVEGARGRTVIQINHGCMLLDGRIAAAVRQRHGIYYERAQKSASALRPNGSIPYSRAFCTILFTICSLSFGRQRLYNRIESCYATEIPTNQDWRRQPWFVRNAAHITRII